MTATGGSITTFADLTGNDLYPTWSPDSKTIAWINENGGTFSIQKKNLNGTGAASLTIGATPIQELAWSPDGTRIALAYQDVGSWDIAVVQSTLVGGTVTNLTNDSVTQGYPAWSPDGSTIYCSSADSNGFLQLARLEGNLWPWGSATASLLTNEPWHHYLGGVSPDGELLACWAGNWFTGGNWNLFYYSASGAPLGERDYIRVTYTNQSDWSPTFLPPTTGGGSVGYE
jgi:Tol biopolymer transport system component